MQSLLALGLQKTSEPTKKFNILAIDEPEAFLHPSVQRTTARLLLGQVNEKTKIIITTHSPIIVEESHYKDIIITSGHNFFMPKKEDAERNEINTAFLSGMGAEMIFSSSILLVEGESDRLFFEAIRRRLASIDITGKIDKLCVVAVGGNNRFVPWLKLLDSFRNTSSQKRFHILSAVDSDSADEVITALQQANLSSDSLKSYIKNLKQKLQDGDIASWRAQSLKCNEELAAQQNPFRFMEGDLEYAILKDVSTASLRKIADAIGFSEKLTKDGVIKWTGSKGIDGKCSNNPNKAPWMRLKIAELIEFPEISDTIKSIIDFWIAGVMNDKERKALYSKANLSIKAAS